MNRLFADEVEEIHQKEKVPVPPRQVILFIDTEKSDGMGDGMQTMTYRTTFALDGTTADHLTRLAELWQVSKAEVVRRAVAQAESAAVPDKPDPVALLRAYHARGGLDPARAKKWLREIREDRRHWRNT